MKRPQILDHKFFHLLDPVTDYIDSGRFFRQPLMWLYYIIGVLTALVPFYAIYKFADLLKWLDGGDVFRAILVWLIFTAVCVGLMLLMFNRAGRLNALMPTDSKFVAIPAIANIIRTFGEYLGLFIGIFFPLAMIIAADSRIAYELDIYEASLAQFIYLIISGFLLIVFTRFLSEAILAIAEIANKTDRIARNTNPRRD